MAQGPLLRLTSPANVFLEGRIECALAAGRHIDSVCQGKMGPESVIGVHLRFVVATELLKGVVGSFILEVESFKVEVGSFKVNDTEHVVDDTRLNLNDVRLNLDDTEHNLNDTEHNNAAESFNLAHAPFNLAAALGDDDR